MFGRLTLATIAWAAALHAAPARAVDCAVSTSGGHEFTTCRVDLRKEALRLYYADAQGSPYEGFVRLRASLLRARKNLAFAMNAGMFHPDLKPVGLLVIDGREIAPVNRSQGHGNFFLEPNGIFLIDQGGARVIETMDYRNLAPTLATQSGPMLVHRGQIPASAAFRTNSNSRYVRNGVCAPAPSVAVFVISDEVVTFREFALYFRDVLGCTEALYLDGAISSLHAPGLRRPDDHKRLGPMFAVVE
ncbi:MAG TPA: phosphodiester glycosidase family protein [Steroidobacteraceae bacterium]|nr:phosphodiester glycosidase family protein [Steroidobacteraceae bacterium]